jgi:hypothetical protein
VVEFITVLPPVLFAMAIAAAAGVGVHRLMKASKDGAGD